MKRAIGYIRVSTEEQAKEGISLAVQEEKILTYAKLWNLGSVEIIKDEGRSAKNLKREGVQKVIRLVKEGEVKHLIIYKIDRLSRDAVDLLTLVKRLFKPNNVQLHSITERIETESAAGKFIFGIFAHTAQLERDLISERTTAALQWKKKNGQDLGTAPLGFEMKDKKFYEVAAELQVVQEIKRLRRKHFTFRAIARQFNEEGIATKQGKRWHPGTVHKIVRSKRYRGRN